jgi:hypothetical protein
MRRSGEDHDAVPKHLRARGFRQPANRLEQLKLLRNQCDYDDVVFNLQLLVAAAISLAQEILTALP